MGCFGWDDGDVTLAAGAEGSAAGTVAAWWRRELRLWRSGQRLARRHSARRNFARRNCAGRSDVPAWQSARSEPCPEPGSAEPAAALRGAWRTWLVVARGALWSVGARDVKNDGRAFAVRRRVEPSCGTNPKRCRRPLAMDKISPSVQCLAATAWMRSANACFAAASAASSISSSMRRRSSKSPRRAWRRRAPWSRWIAS